MLENHVRTTRVHEIFRNGYHLVDKIQETTINPKATDGSPRSKMTIMIYSRSIDDRSYAVQWNLTEGEYEDRIRSRMVETEITQEEVQRFEEDWCSLWNPMAKADLD